MNPLCFIFLSSLEKRPDVESVILCGIETHACIHHTTLELIDQGKKKSTFDGFISTSTKLPHFHIDIPEIMLFLGIDVHIVVDCCSSRSMTDRKYALERLRDVGAFLTTSESVILGLAPDAAHPKFKQIQKLVMHSALDTGLL